MFPLQPTKLLVEHRADRLFFALCSVHMYTFTVPPFLPLRSRDCIAWQFSPCFLTIFQLLVLLWMEITKQPRWYLSHPHISV